MCSRCGVWIERMTDIHIRKTHNMDRRAARARVEQLAKSLQGKLAADYHWEGDSLRFVRSGASGSIDVSRAGVVEVDVKLGLVLRPMKALIESTIHDGFDSIVADS